MVIVIVSQLKVVKLGNAVAIGIESTKSSSVLINKVGAPLTTLKGYVDNPIACVDSTMVIQAFNGIGILIVNVAVVIITSKAAN